MNKKCACPLRSLKSLNLSIPATVHDDRFEISGSRKFHCRKCNENMKETHGHLGTHQLIFGEGGFVFYMDKRLTY